MRVESACKCAVAAGTVPLAVVNVVWHVVSIDRPASG